jgi:hypothetical protein
MESNVPGATSPGCPLAANLAPMAFQANTNYLYLYENGVPTNTWDGMLPGTVPSLVVLPTAALPLMAFQDTSGRLYLYNANTWQTTGTGRAMQAGTSPSMTIIQDSFPATHVVVAYQGQDGYLHLYYSSNGSDKNTGVMMLGSPSITAIPTQNFGQLVVAYKARASGYCSVYFVGSGKTSLCSGNTSEPAMMAGTSPSIASGPQVNYGEYVTVFQGSDGYLYKYNSYISGGSTSGGNMWWGMMAGSSPSVTTLLNTDTAFAFQANTGFLFTWVNGALTDTSQIPGFPRMTAHASPSILPASGWDGYQVAFEADSTYLYVDYNGIPLNTWEGMNSPP